MSWKVIFVLAIHFFLSINTWAQGYINIASADWQVSPSNSIENSTEKVDIIDITTSINLPLKLKNKDVILINPTYSYLSFTAVQNGGLYLNATSLNLGYIKKFKNSGSLLVMALPKISSDFKNIGSNDYQIGGLLLYSKQKTPVFKYKLGVYYNKEFFGPLITPIFGLDWKINSKFRLFGNLPINGTLNYQLNKKWSSGFYFNSRVGSYKISETVSYSYLQKTTTELFIYQEFKAAHNIVLKARIGYSVGRSYRQYNANDKVPVKISAFSIGGNRTQLNPTISNGFLAGISLYYRVNLEN